MFNKDEKKVLIMLVKERIEALHKDEDSVMHVSPGFLKGEVDYERFLKDIIKKLS